MARHQIVVVTPAGRRAYLEILQSHLLADASIDAWHLWDNCRDPRDRAYVEGLAERHAKIRLVRAVDARGDNRSINQFYRLTRDPDTFYVKMDDDIVHLPTDFGARFYRAAAAEAGRFTWWSPLVINNALCSWLIKHHSRVRVEANLSAVASSELGWRDPRFAEALHRRFLAALAEGTAEDFAVPDFAVSLSRFSINCIGYFGADAAAWGDGFCPIGVDDEDWISAVLPSRTGRPGRIVGGLVVSHFAFFPQEADLLRTDLLARYAGLAGVAPPPPPKPRRPTPVRDFGLRLWRRHLAPRPEWFPRDG